MPRLCRASPAASTTGFTFDVAEKPKRKLELPDCFYRYADYLPTLGIKLLAGRNFSEAFPTDSTDGYYSERKCSKATGLDLPRKLLAKK